MHNFLRYQRKKYTLFFHPAFNPQFFGFTIAVKVDLDPLIEVAWIFGIILDDDMAQGVGGYQYIFPFRTGTAAGRANIIYIQGIPSFITKSKNGGRWLPLFQITKFVGSGHLPAYGCFGGKKRKEKAANNKTKEYKFHAYQMYKQYRLLLVRLIIGT